MKLHLKAAFLQKRKRKRPNFVTCLKVDARKERPQLERRANKETILNEPGKADLDETKSRDKPLKKKKMSEKVSNELGKPGLGESVGIVEKPMVEPGKRRRSQRLLAQYPGRLVSEPAIQIPKNLHSC